MPTDKQQVQYSIDDLRYLMARLRDPKTGCPWDLKQSARDIVNYSIEEVYELADAIENGSPSETCDELGDVLFQVVFLSRLAEESGDYDLNDVISSIVSKLVRRHPHVFHDGNLRGKKEQNSDGPSENAVKENWEAIKQQERESKQRGGLFDEIPQSLPALSLAAKLQKRAARVGLDWPDAIGPLAKIREETDEIAECLSIVGKASNEGESQIADDIDRDQLTEEIGDLLFSTVNLCRKLGVSPEQALRVANRKFVGRAQGVCDHPEFEAVSAIKDADQRLSALDELWDQAKRI